MPPKKITVKTGTVPNIMVMLTKPTTKSTSDKKSESVDTKSDFLTSAEGDLTHEDPLIQEYYNSLTPNEKIAHTIAKDKLGTSYDVSRTHGFLRWQKSRK